MRRATTILVCGSGVGILWSVLAIPRGVAVEPTDPPPGVFKPAMPLEALMEEQGHHFERLTELVRNEQEPERLKKLQHEALVLAEMANVNGYHEGAVVNQDYKDWTLQMKAQALTLAQLAAEDKKDALRDAVKQLNATCKACHDKYQE